VEQNTHTFIVRIWLEKSAEEAGRATWRGRVTHVPSGEERTVETLDQITAFVTHYLRTMGVELGKLARASGCPHRWWRRWAGWRACFLRETERDP